MLMHGTWIVDLEAGETQVDKEHVHHLKLGTQSTAIDLGGI